MNILFCSPYTKVGGISSWTKHILKFSKNNNKVSLTLFYESRNISILNKYPFLRRISKGFFSYLPMYFNLKKKLDKEHYDIVHLCSSASLSLFKDLLLLHTCKRHKTKSILHFHFGRIPFLFKVKNWEYQLIIRAIKMADKVIVIDESSYMTLQKAGFTNVAYLPNPISQNVINIAKENSSIIRKKRSILFVGHVIKTKGVFELIEACRSIENISLKLIGPVEDDMKKKIERAAGEGANTWMEITGTLNYEATIKEMLSTEIFVLPTYTEGFPNVILESMACACPIITTNVGAIPEMLDTKNGDYCGICITPQNTRELKNAIEKMLQNKTYATQCGLNAQQRVQKEYSIEYVWRQLFSIWNSLN